MSVAVAPAATGGPERLFSLRELEAAGYGSRSRLQTLVKSGVVPTIWVGNARKVRARDLHKLAESTTVDLTAVEPLPHDGGPSADQSDSAFCDALAQRIVSTWPRLSADQKAELGRLLATA